MARRRGTEELARIQARREKWQAVLLQWQQSGLALAEFCRVQELALWQLSWWKRKFEREAAALDLGVEARPVGLAPGRASRRRGRSSAPDKQASGSARRAQSAFLEAVIVPQSVVPAASKSGQPGAALLVGAAYEVVLTNGRRLLVTGAFEPSALAMLLDVLEARV